MISPDPKMFENNGKKKWWNRVKRVKKEETDEKKSSIQMNGLATGLACIVYIAYCEPYAFG